MKFRLTAILAAAAAVLGLANQAFAQQPPGTDQTIGQHFEITADSLPGPYAEPSRNNPPRQVARGESIPIVPEGFTVTLYAEGLANPRRLAVLADGTVLLVQQALGRVVKLRDIDGNGAADQLGLVAEGLLEPFGIAEVPVGPWQGDLLIADADAVYRLSIVSGGFEPTQVTPDGAFGVAQGHITRELEVDPKTGALYIGIGSIANLGEEPAPKATIQRFDADGANQATFASGLRNPTGLGFDPATGALYAVVMERDGMGDRLVPDFFSKVDEGDFFGWPYQYTGGFVQPELADQAPKVAAAKMPSVLFEAHSAPMDLVFLPPSWPEGFAGTAIAALKGSSNRGEATGYKLVHILFADGAPTGAYENFATNFWVAGGDADSRPQVWGRPAALAIMPDGGLLVADDFGGTLWKIMPPPKAE